MRFFCYQIHPDKKSSIEFKGSDDTAFSALLNKVKAELKSPVQKVGNQTTGNREGRNRSDSNIRFL